MVKELVLDIVKSAMYVCIWCSLFKYGYSLVL